MRRDTDYDFARYARELRRALKPHRQNPGPALGSNPDRNLQILDAWLNINNTYPEIAESHKVASRQRVQQIVRKTARQVLSEYYSERGIEKPPPSVPRRPLGEKIRFRRSAIQGGKLEEVVKIAKKTTDPQAIMDKVGIDRVRLNHYREKVKAHGLEIELSFPRPNIETARTAFTETPPNLTHLQPAYTDLPINHFRRLRKEGVVLPLSRILRQLGYSEGGLSRARAVLEQVNIPYGHIRQTLSEGSTASKLDYYFAALNQIPGLEKIFKGSPEMQSIYRPDMLKQIAGPASAEPKRANFYNRKVFLSATAFLKELGVPSEIKPDYFFSDPTCPAPIWCYKGRYFFLSRLKSPLETFTKARLRKLATA